MERPNTVAGLLEKRAEIAGQIAFHQAELQRLNVVLGGIDSTIRLFDPDADLTDAKAKPYPPPYTPFRGELARLVLTFMRTAPGPVTGLEIAHEVMRHRGLPEDATMAQTISRRVAPCMRKLRVQGLVRHVETGGKAKAWALV